MSESASAWLMARPAIGASASRLRRAMAPARQQANRIRSWGRAIANWCLNVGGRDLSDSVSRVICEVGDAAALCDPEAYWSIRAGGAPGTAPYTLVPSGSRSREQGYALIDDRVSCSRQSSRQQSGTRAVWLMSEARRRVLYVPSSSRGPAGAVPRAEGYCKVVQTHCQPDWNCQVGCFVCQAGRPSYTCMVCSPQVHMWTCLKKGG